MEKESARRRGVNFDCARGYTCAPQRDAIYLPGGRASGLSARLTRGDLQFATPGSTGKIYNANPAAFGWREQKIFFCDVFGFKIRSRMSRKKRLSSDEAIHAPGLEKPSEFPVMREKIGPVAMDRPM